MCKSRIDICSAENFETPLLANNKAKTTTQSLNSN